MSGGPSLQAPPAPPAPRWLMLKGQPGLGPAASHQADPGPQGGFWPALCLLLPPLTSPGLAPRSPSSSRRCRGRMRAAGVSRLWRINIPGTSPRPPAHAEENITAISGGSSACTQYLDGEFGVINLALSSSLRGPRGSGMFGMGKKLASAAILQGALWGSARAAAVPRAGCGPPDGPPGGQITPRLWPSADCQWMRVCSESQPTRRPPQAFLSPQPPLFRPVLELWPHCTSRRLSVPQFPPL